VRPAHLAGEHRQSSPAWERPTLGSPVDGARLEKTAPDLRLPEQAPTGRSESGTGAGALAARSGLVSNHPADMTSESPSTSRARHSHTRYTTVPVLWKQGSVNCRGLRYNTVRNNQLEADRRGSARNGVKRAWRPSGIAARLVREMIGWAKSAGAEAIYVSATHPSQPSVSTRTRESG
jgi:GNAT superfamily N-acetyltransferase